ncbi:SAICAR synthase-like protein [Piromyces finnis]|uniref:SAICAR synthase-like protein n=1 Tax=Piromyces finnis TaxID=1754191 RepID=A0A1Y1U972_9FUNG|nr:SAICAR synthase-like protein [Piromyces finnis]|eukprot:ORX34094.1 SAICAR synthase-like protein [Piromyces finnis]
MTVGRDDSTDPMMKPSRDISISFPELGNSPSQSSPLQSIVNHNESLEENANANANVTENDNNIEFDLEMGKLDAKDAVEEDEEEDEIESMNDRNELDEEEGEDGDDEEEEEEDEKVVESKEDVKRNSLHKFNMKSLTTNKLRKMKINKARRSRSRSLLINHSGGRFDNDPYSYGRIQMLLMENSFSPFKDHPFFNGKHKLKSISSVFGSPVDSNYLFMNVIKNDDNNDDNNIAPVEIDKNLLTFKDDDDKKENTSLKINTNITNFSHLIDDALPIISDSLNNANSEDVGIEPESIIMEKKNSMNESLMILPGSPQRVKTDPTLDTSSIYSKNTFLESDAKSHDQKFQMDDDAEQNSPLLEMEYIDSLLVSETADNATTIMSDIRPSMPNPTTSVFLRTNSIHKLKRTNSVKEQRVKMDLENGNRFDSRHDKPENEENILTSPPLSLTDRNSKDNNLALTSLEYDLPLDITDVISVTPLTYNNESDNETDTEIEKMSIMKTLSQFWTNSSHFSPLDYPFPPDQHIFRGSLVIVREDEPSSVIAFALNSREYRNSLLQQQQQFQPQSLPRRHNNSIHSVGHNGSIINALTSYATTTSVNSAVDSENLNTPVSAVTNGSNVNTTNGSTNLVETQNSALPTHSNASGIVNDDNVPDEENTTREFMDGSTRIFCKIFYPEKFENLRKNCGVDKIYIQSLSHCLKWSNDGVNQVQPFLKTRDDRFIVKQLSRPEMDAFLKFADEYFEYLNNVFYNKTPTSLAKIYGIYRFGIKNPNSGKNIRMDVLVMEISFMVISVQRVLLEIDMHNLPERKMKVLLDENLLELINEQPLYIREYSKNLLFTSVWKDTSFLSQLNVMDYSLVVGVDNETQELITGIVETFTWDKKLESWGKRNSILGGGGKDPTIISPVQYKNRFRESMARYFLMVN